MSHHNKASGFISVKALLFLFSIVLFVCSIIAGLEIFPALHQVMVHIFLLFGFFIILRHIVLLYAAWKRKRSESSELTFDTPFVSIIIPAFNEEEVIADSLNSLLALDYPNYEVVMVDDGSTDNTVTIARRIKADSQAANLTIITQTNSGKASALNTGLLHTQGALVLCVDSDSKLNSQALRWGVQHFSDPGIGAVAGYVEVANTRKLITRFQELEYIVSQGFIRQALAWFGAVTVIPGPVGLFRREALVQVGGYSEDKSLFAEDADLTVRLLAKNWRIVSEDRMIARTEAPEEVYALLRQRYRWKRGIYQTFHLNFRDLILSPQPRLLPVTLFLILESFFMEIFSFSITLFILASFFRFAELKFLYAWLGLLITLDILVLMLAIGKQWWRWLPLLFLQKLIYGYALQAWGVLSLLDEWRSTQMSWDKVERIGGLSES
jgi:cellulose synthase/poly-beta-1,6-N-acetylglucosamine synthase-like glycosyltransferase